MNASGDRRLKRREQTRRRIIDATQALMAQRGTDAGIAEIAHAADIGTGTFYNYFPSREALLSTIAESSMETVGSILDERISQLEDPAEVLSSSLRHLVRRSLSDRVWGGFLVQMGAAHPTLLRILGPRARRDLLHGLESRRFHFENLELATTCIFVSLIATIQQALEAEFPEDYEYLFSAAMLRMLGLSVADAREVAHRPLPDIDDS